MPISVRQDRRWEVGTVSDCKIQGMMERLFSDNPKHEASVTSITTRYVHTREAYPMLKRSVFNFYVVGEERIPAMLVEGEVLSKVQVKTFRLITHDKVSKFKCAMCSHKQCEDGCHYQGSSDDHLFMILDDLMKLSKAFFSAVEKGLFDVAAEIGDEILEIVAKYDLPEPDPTRSGFTMIQFETNSRLLRRFLGERKG